MQERGLMLIMVVGMCDGAVGAVGDAKCCTGYDGAF
jgi:hypothetical protein